MPAAPPRFEDTEEIPSWENTTEIVEERPPERESFVEPPTRPEMPVVSGPFVGDGPNDIPPGMEGFTRPSFAATPEEFDQRMAADVKRGKLGEEAAGLAAESNIIGNAERAVDLAQEGVISPRVAEMALAVGAPSLNATPGIRRSVAESASGMTSPVNLGMLIGGGAAAAIPKLGGAVARGIAGGFAADIAGHMPKLGTAAGTAFGVGTAEEQQKAIADIALSAGMGGLAGAGVFYRGVAPIPPRVIETIAKADAVGLTKSAQALADVVKRDTQVSKPAPNDTLKAGETVSDRVQQLEAPIEKSVPEAEVAAPQKPAEATTTETVPQPANSAAPAQLIPVLVTPEGKTYPGVSHADALARALADVKTGRITPDEFAAVGDAMMADAQHQFLDPATGKILNRSEAAKAVGAKGELQSESLNREQTTRALEEYQKARAGEGPAAPDQTTVAEPSVGAVPENVPAAGTNPAEGFTRLYRGEGEPNLALPEWAKTNAGEWFTTNPAKAQEFANLRKGKVRFLDVPTKRIEQYLASEGNAPDEFLIPKQIHKNFTGGEIPANQAKAFFERESEAAGLGRSSLPPTVADVRAQRAADALEPVAPKTSPKIGEIPQNPNDFGGPILESTPLDPASGAPIAPPARPPGQPPARPGAQPSPAPQPAPRATLDDVYKIFEPAPKESKGIGQRASEAVEAFRTGFSSKFRPLNKLAADIAAKIGGTAKDVAGIFEQLKGSSGKAEADVYRFDKDVSDLVKGSEKDFNAYVFLRRSLDRLQQDAADIARAQAGENVPKLNRRRVSQYTIPQLEAKLAALSEQIGGEKLAKFSQAVDAFQTHMDQALRLQVESGRMAPEVYDAIKAGNQFYAPFKVMRYVEESAKPEGSGRKVDTLADFTKAMEGIDDPNVKLGDMLAAARQNITLSRTLAEKNRAMQNITELAALDVNGDFVRKLKPGAEAPKGMETVNVLENGVKERYAVNSDVAQAVDNAGPGLPAGIVARWSSNLFRAGATTLNLAFQPVNLLAADAPRAALVSKYGVKGVTDLVRYPMDFVESLLSSISADVFGVKNKLFQDFLDSGAAGTTVQQYLTPEALKFKPETATSKTKAVAKTVLNTIPQFANAIEQTSKVLGVKRAMRLEGVESGEALARQIPEAITEIRRFSGSPDFGRSGKWTEQYRLNLIYMFLNARIQGAVADVGRLTGRDGKSTAAKTWLKMGTAVGIPTAYLYMLNNSDEYRDDYAKRPAQEKQNYWLIPKDTFITGSNGEKIRDYWRVPKREIAQWMGNAVESGLDFAKERDPDAFWKWAAGMAESIAPINIRGNTLQERGESVLSGTHPFIKAPIETFSGRDTYRHRPIVPDSQKKASPEQQYDERTPDVFKTLADAMPDVAPEVFRSPKMLENLTKNFSAGLLTQFLPKKPVEGRSAAENLPLTERFQGVPYTDSSEFDQRIQKFERESADEQLTRMRNAKTILEENKGAKPDVLIKQMISKYGRDEKLAERIVDLYTAEQRGITPQERRVLALPVTQRAEFMADELKGKSSEAKAALLRNWALKRIMTERVAAELAPKINP